VFGTVTLLEYDDFASSSTAEQNEPEKSGTRFTLCWTKRLLYREGFLNQERTMVQRVGAMF
jgi:hypothetical protein